jgi:L-ascorbate metabolism protein UlaG (beta-lactamase superfamily)
VVPRDTSIQYGSIAQLDEAALQVVLARALQVDMQPARLEAVFGAAVAEQLLPAWGVRWDGFRDGGPLLVPELLFPAAAAAVELSLALAGQPEIRLVARSEPAVRKLASILRQLTGAAAQDFADCLGALAPELAAALPPEDVGSAPEWQAFPGCGVQRREHASLLIRSRTTALLVDPIALAGVALPGIERAPRTAPDGLAAILVTHQHGDHWHLPTLAQHSGGLLPVVVPEVPRRNLLCPEEFVAPLRALALQPRPLAWHQVLEIGDVRIAALPFHGEQPCRRGPGPLPGLRNLGNTYRIDAPEFSVLVLADAGADPDGSMEEVVRDSAGRHGPVDLVLACCREFPAPFFGGLPRDWLALPLDAVVAQYARYRAGQLEPSTAGIAGIARICAAAGARCFAPYAHGFTGVGQPIDDIGWGGREASEQAVCTALAAELARIGAATRVLQWNCGDRLEPAPGGRWRRARQGPAQPAAAVDLAASRAATQR